MHPKTRTRSFSKSRPYHARSRKPQVNRGKGQYIHPSKFVSPARLSEAEVYTPQHQFSDFDVASLIKDNLTAKGFQIPTPIQDQAIPPALEGKDIIGIAHTGTGKTTAFAVPMLNALMKNSQDRALIIAPTRELAQQIEEECRSIARGSGLSGVIIIGGASMSRQLRDLRNRPRIVIGTPGRIKDHLERGTLDLSRFNHVVLDEVDRMLDMGFIRDIRLILERTAKSRQSYFFSATMDARVRGLIDTFSTDPVMISLKTGETTDSVEQTVVEVRDPSAKIDKLHDILITAGVDKSIVFESTKYKVERLSKELAKRGFAADSIHGGKNQSQRQRALRRFKQNEITILVATDVAARGIDVGGVTHVINYTQPQTYQDYIHRIGRAGRAGRIGYAMTFV